MPRIKGKKVTLVGDGASSATTLEFHESFTRSSQQIDSITMHGFPYVKEKLLLSWDHQGVVKALF